MKKKKDLKLFGFCVIISYKLMLLQSKIQHSFWTMLTFIFPLKHALKDKRIF